jgi:MoCo/4Fe-4S cofactor protein with predicted Tat translocation signal
MSRRKPFEFGPAPKGTPMVWRSLEEKHRDPEETRKLAETEFPTSVVEPANLVGRRAFLGVTGASAAVAFSGCIRRPVNEILPFTEQVEYRVPGAPVHYATVAERRGEAIGLLVESHEGRPTKVEGNPVHPASKGGTDAFAQASVLDLYDPDRSPAPARRVDGAWEEASWDEFDKVLAELARSHEGNGGDGLRLLVTPSTSPSVLRMREQVRRRFPGARIHRYASVSDQNALDGARVAFGEHVRPVYALDQAQVVLALDSDFLVTETGAVRNARAFAERRRPASPQDPMSRLYVVEGTFSVTGGNADHRLRLPSSQVEAYLRALAAELVTKHGVELAEVAGAVRGGGTPKGVPARWVKVVAEELATHQGRAPILVGERQPARVHALAWALNHALGNVGASVQLVPAPTAAAGEGDADLASLAADLEAGRVRTLFILGGNPAYDAPADVNLAQGLAKDGVLSVHLSTHRDETSQLCNWHLPMTHALEQWGDLRALDGTLAIQQPLIAPLYPARSELEVTAMLAGLEAWRGYGLVRATVRTEGGVAGAFESFWRGSLHSGVVGAAGLEPLAEPAVRSSDVVAALGAAQAAQAPTKDALEVVFLVDYGLFDGRHGNNPWMLELPNTMTKTVWGNAAWLSPKTAAALGVRTDDVVRLSRQGARDIEIPVFVLPGHADWVVTLPLGWGRSSAGRYGNGVGFDVHPLRTRDGFGFASGVRLEKTSGSHKNVQSQEHSIMEGRPIAIDATREPVRTGDPRYADMPAYSDSPEFAAYRTVLATTPPLWEQVDYSGVNKWGMTIDLSACTGCNACVVACQAENNIPSVGRTHAALGRMMHWIRLDRYFVGMDEDNPLVALQPVACQQCEEAPCENVCPVNATVHSPEGLNDMSYNRCVGTRYCMNNCPYKVRKFNYLNWNTYLHSEDGEPRTYGDMPETLKMQYNPNVTVRFRGVMEKCTYCVQRIERHKVVAKREKRSLRTDEFTSACAQACPSSAITFGNLNDADAAVTRWAAVDRSYKLLAEIGTQPRTTFLGKIRNPNPAMLQGSATTEAG